MNEPIRGEYEREKSHCCSDPHYVSGCTGCRAAELKTEVEGSIKRDTERNLIESERTARRLAMQGSKRDTSLKDRIKAEVDDMIFKDFSPLHAQGVSVTTDAKARKATPIASGVLDYFPDALLAVAELSRIGNDQHNPGQPLHWAKEKSTDEADALLRHLIDRGKMDVDGVRHSAKVAWRALALLQREVDAERIAKSQK
jgi:hypothetical protein